MSNLDRERHEGLYLKFSEPMMEPHTPVIIERVNGDCTVSKFIIARDEAHELINQLSEFLHVGSPRKVGEDGPVTRETLEHWLRVVKSTLDPDGWDCGAPELRRMREQLEFALDPLLLRTCGGAKVIAKTKKTVEQVAEDHQKAFLDMEAKRNMLWQALKAMHAKMNCVCRLNPMVGEPVPCETCRIAVLLERAR